MDEDWDDDTPTTAMNGVIAEGGTKFAAGRGFTSVVSTDNDNDDVFGGNTWDNGGGGGGGDDRPARGGRGGGRGGRGGRGGGRGRGGGGNYRGDRNDGGGNYRGDRNGGSWGDGYRNNNDGNHWANGSDDGNNEDRYSGRGRGGGGGGRGRGGRGRGGGRGGRNDDKQGGSWEENKGQDGEESQKPKEIYIPVERITDDELFTSTITSGVNFIKLDDIDVKVTGENVPQPLHSFENSGLRPHLLQNVAKSGYTKLTPIQKYAIPIILAGRDLMACAQTGSGKTAAFLLPIIHKLLENQEPPIRDGNSSQPKVVIVSPTRELAIQIYEQAKKFAYNSIVKTAVIYGGTSVNHQRSVIASGCHILVATPGRLNDFVKHGHVSFASAEFFVLDEADRMLDMGFLPNVEEMLGHGSMVATGERQTLMFSATFPEEIQLLAGKFLHSYVFVAVGIVGSASTDVEQEFHPVTRFEKRDKLIQMLKDNNERTVVFVETKRNADFLAAILCENDIQATSIHGDRLQREREQALWDFKKGIRNILVATGVAARGLDIEGIQHVINYDLPKSIDEYVHRIGRTGRVGNRGKASSFFDSQSDSALSSSLANILKQAGQTVPDFLSDGGGRDHGYSDNFGGRDIRGDDFGQGQDFVQQPAELVDEEW